MAQEQQEQPKREPARVSLEDVPLRELETELARSRILATAVKHIREVGDIEKALFSLDFSLTF